MKKTTETLCRFFFAFLACMTAFSIFGGRFQACAQEYEPDRTPVLESGDYAYKLYTDGTLEIVEYSGQEADVVIPAELDGNRVTMIGSEAFAYCEMTTLTIPEGILVSGRAFSYCTITEALILPAGVDIRIRAFEYAKLPKTLVIPAGATIGGDSFSYCKNLETLFVEPLAAVKGSSFNYSKDLKTLVCASGSEIADRAFYSSRSLSEILLCGDVKLGEKAFPYCENATLRQEGEERYESELEKTLGSQKNESAPDERREPAEQKSDEKIGKEAALIIATDDAGVKPRAIRYRSIKLMEGQGGFYYEVVFEHGAYKYEYEIGAYTGDILSAKKSK